MPDRPTVIVTLPASSETGAEASSRSDLLTWAGEHGVALAPRGRHDLVLLV